MKWPLLLRTVSSIVLCYSCTYSFFLLTCTYSRPAFEKVYNLYGDVPSDARDGDTLKPALGGRQSSPSRIGSVPIPRRCRPPFASLLRRLVNPIQLHLQQVKSNPAALMAPLFLLSKLAGIARPTRTVGQRLRPLY